MSKPKVFGKQIKNKQDKNNNTTNTMKKTLFVLVLSGFLFLPVMGLASVEPAPDVPLITGISRIIDIVFTILIAAAALFVMVGAFQFVTAGGDTEKVGAAREKILYAVIAVVVALLARGIITFIRGAFPAV